MWGKDSVFTAIDLQKHDWMNEHNYGIGAYIYVINAFYLCNRQCSNVVLVQAKIGKCIVSPSVLCVLHA